MQNAKNNYEILRMPPENTNSVLVCRGDICAVFDPWGRASDWINLIQQRGLKLHAIYCTHGHPDHISAASEIAAHYGVPWHLSRADWDLIGWGGQILSAFGLPQMNTPVAPTDVAVGNVEILPGINANLIACPGHTRGGVSYLFGDDGVLLTGDTLFRDAIGRYDLPGGDIDALRRSIAGLYKMNLPDDTNVIHGHGAMSTIGILKSENPYFHA